MTSYYCEQAEELAKLRAEFKKVQKQDAGEKAAPPRKGKRKSNEPPPQKNTIKNFFKTVPKKDK